MTWPFLRFDTACALASQHSWCYALSIAHSPWMRCSLAFLGLRIADGLKEIGEAKSVFTKVSSSNKWQHLELESLTSGVWWID